MKFTNIISYYIIAFLLLSAGCAQCEKNIHKAETPPMGWNSWDCFGTDVDEQTVKANADFIAKNLKFLGYEYVIVDMGWYLKPEVTTYRQQISSPPLNIDNYGRLIPDTIKFPSSRNGKGFKPLADYVHSKGLKFGIHIHRGVPWEAVEKDSPIKGTDIKMSQIANNDICEWFKAMKGIDHSKKGAQEYYNSIMELYSEWQIDYLKIDDITRPYREKDIENIYKAVEKTGRDIFISLSPGATPIEKYDHVKQYSNSWRISNDFWDKWEMVISQMNYGRNWQGSINQGGYPDCDMLPFGKLRVTGGDEWIAGLLNDNYQNIGNEYSRFNKNEMQTVMSYWCMFKSPLMLGGHLPESDSLSLSVITNPYIININQHSINNKELKHTNDYCIWTADDPATGSKYLALFNISETDPLTLKCSWDELSIHGNYKVFEIWDEKNIGIIAEAINAEIPAHGTKVYILNPNIK